MWEKYSINCHFGKGYRLLRCLPSSNLFREQISGYSQITGYVA